MKLEILTKLHEAHQGIRKTKIRAKTCQFWHIINNNIEYFTKSCNICQKFPKHQRDEPLNNHQMQFICINKVNNFMHLIQIWRIWRYSGTRPSENQTYCTEVKTFCYILTFDPAQNAIQSDALEGSDTFQWQLGEEIVWAEIGKKKWDKLKKSHDTLIDWRTGREWLVYCMTVISAWWRLNMQFQRSSGRSSGRWTIIWHSWVWVTVGDGVIDEMW